MEVTYDGTHGSITGLTVNECEYLFSAIKFCHTTMSNIAGMSKETKNAIVSAVNSDVRFTDEDEKITEKDGEEYDFLFNLYNKMEGKINWLRPISEEFDEANMFDVAEIKKESDGYRLNHVYHSEGFQGVDEIKLSSVREGLFKYISGIVTDRYRTWYYNAGNHLIFGNKRKDGNIFIYQTENFKRYDYIKGEPNKKVKCVSDFYSKSNPDEIMEDRLHPFIEVGAECTVLHEADVEGSHYYTFAEYTIKEAAEMWYLSKCFEPIKTTNDNEQTQTTITPNN